LNLHLHSKQPLLTSHLVQAVARQASIVALSGWKEMRWVATPFTKAVTPSSIEVYAAIHWSYNSWFLLRFRSRPETGPYSERITFFNL
jgi:hypothetical protein